MPHPNPDQTQWWQKLLPIPVFSLLLLGFGCTMAQQRSDTTSLPKKPPHLVAEPLKTSPSVPPPFLSSHAAILIDAKTGETLYEKNADQKMPVASTQKVLTALVALEEGPLHEKLPVSLTAAMEPPSKIWLRWKESYTRQDLLEATLIESANDAATTLAEGKNFNQFINKMNLTAKKFGAKNSNFTNAHGLDSPNQYSTARDMAKIAFHAYRNPFIRRTCIKPTQYLSLNKNTEILLRNTNPLITGYTFNGLKGGFTFQSGKTLIATTKKGDKEILIVLLKANPNSIHHEAERLWKWYLKSTR
jgi:D-alanyl-D-alanine carboxypeptidase (penicillin-binding protein 5/6)